MLNLKRTIYLIFLIGFLSHFLAAQSEGEKTQIKKLDSIAFEFENIPQYDSAIKYYSKELEIYLKAKNNKEIGRTYLKMGRMVSEKGDISEASKIFFKMLEYSEKANDTTRISIAYTRIGRCYEFLNQHQKALEYYYRALTISEKYNIHKQSIALYGSIGNLYLQQAKYDDCKKIAFRSDSLSSVLNDPYFKYGSNNLLGLYYTAINDYSKAEKYLQSALTYNLSKNPNSSHTAGTYFNLGDIASKQNHKQDAINYYSKALNIFKQQNEKKNLKDICYNLAALYSETGDFKKAFEYQKLYSAYNDSIINQETNNTIAELQTKYEVDKKDSRIKLLDKDRLIKEQKLEQAKQKQYLYIGFSILAILLLMASILFFIQRQKTISAINKSNLVMVRLQTQMNPHFIFNALVSIQDLILKVEKSKAINAISKLAKLMRSTLNNSEKEFISLKDEISFLTTYVEFENERNENEVKFFTEIAEEISEEWCLIPPMLIQPLIENCFKHAFNHNTSNGEIKLSVKIISMVEQKLLQIKVSDNGLGINGNRTESKALGIIQNRILQLAKGAPIKGTFIVEDQTINPEIKKGTTVTLTIPYIE